MTCESKSNRHGMAPREWTKAEVRRCTMSLPRYLLLYRSRGQQQRCILVRPYHQDSMVAAEKATETKIEWCDLSKKPTDNRHSCRGADRTYGVQQQLGLIKDKAASLAALYFQ